MKKVFLILLFPLLVSFQCEDDIVDSGFETIYLISNESALDLYSLNENEQFVQINSMDEITLGSILNPETSPISPSESLLFSNIRLYRVENGDFILVYTQDPLDDALWTFAEPQENRYEYTLTITDASLD